MNPSLDPILRPRSIAVIGASRTPRTISHEIVAALVRNGFTGAVYPVNPKARAIGSIPAWPDVGAIPEAVDLAVVVVPRDQVLPAVEQCAAKGIRGLVVISAGFKETGAEGAELERRLTDFVRSKGIRMVGPNCMGVLNADPAISMNATFAPRLPPFGRAAFVSQSGAMGLSVLDYAREFGIGISQFVSVGNKPDVSGNDLLLAWEHDPAVGVILMYVENFGNPRKFLEIASRITRRKPIIMVKSGRSHAGARAASSHTGALAASDVTVDALMQQAGVLRAGSVEELFDLAMAFSGQPLPRSRRTAILTNAGGPGILVADALDAGGLEVVELAAETVRRLQPLFPDYASVRNPLDMIASATPAGYRTALSALLDDPGVDSAVAIFVPPLGVSQEDVTEAIAAAVREGPGKPVLAVLMGQQGLPQGRAELHEANIPAYIFPESAARALAALCRQREWQDRPPADRTEAAPVDAGRAAAMLERAAQSGVTKLPELDALALLASYGIPFAPARVAASADAAVAAAAEVGYPVALKVMAPTVIHKTDVGGVRLGLTEDSAVRLAFDELLANLRRAAPDARPEGVLVQHMVAPGREVIVGGTRDPSFGPLVMVGLGGVFVEVFRDVSFRLAPVTRLEAREMIRGLRGLTLLDGVRGAQPIAFDALEDVILRIALLMLDHPLIQELDVNPLVTWPDGAVAVDARVLISAPAPRGRGTPLSSAPTQ